MNPSNKAAYYGIFAALGILMGYVEQLIPLPIPVPGIKLGLANVIVLLVLYRMGEKEAFGISILRILLSGLLFQGFAGFLYSLSGAALSFVAMVILKRIKGFSVIGVSVGGGVCHNIGQIITASLVVQNVRLLYYLPILFIAGVITGMAIGICAKYCLPHLYP